LKLAFRGEHAKEVPDQQGLLHDFVPLARLENLDRWLVPELRLDNVVERIKVDSIVAFLDSAHVLHPGKIEDALAVQANDASFVEL